MSSTSGHQPGSTDDKTFTLENQAEVGNLGVESISLGGADRTQFEIVGEPCTPSLAADSGCQVDVEFQPCGSG